MHALSDIYDSMGRQICFVAYSLLKNHHDAEDILQTELCEISTSAHSFKPMSNARAWILSIARNQALKHRRDEKAHLSFDEIGNERQYADDRSFLPDLTMFDVMTALSDNERQVVLLHIKSGLKFRVILQLLQRRKHAILSARFPDATAPRVPAVSVQNDFRIKRIMIAAATAVIVNCLCGDSPVFAADLR